MAEEDEELAFLLAESEAVETTNSSNGSTKFYEAVEEVPEEPEPVDEGPIKVGDGECKICHEPTFRPPGLTKTGRLKRAPIYCDIHNPKIRDRDIPVRDLEAQLRRVQGEIADEVMLVGMGVGTFFPVTGYYMVSNSEAMVAAVLQLSKNNARVMRVAHRMAQISPVYQVGKYAAGLVTSVQVDQQKADPRSRVAQHLGVTEAWQAVYANSNINSTPSNGTNLNPNSGWSGPPRYATVQ